MPWAASDFDGREINSVFRTNVDFLAIPGLNEGYLHNIVERLRGILTQRAEEFSSHKDDYSKVFEEKITVFTQKKLDKWFGASEKYDNNPMFSFIYSAIEFSPKIIFIVLTEEFPYSDLELESLWKYAFSCMSRYDDQSDRPMMSAIGEEISRPLIFMFNKYNASRLFKAANFFQSYFRPLAKKKSLFGGWRYSAWSNVEQKMCKSFKFKYVESEKSNILTQFLAIEKLIFEKDGQIIWNEQPFRSDYQKFLFEDID